MMLAVVALAAAYVLRGPLTTQRFTIDESRWISASSYFWITFIDRDMSGPAWRPSYVVLTQPPVARYLIGLGLWLQGWSREDLNGRYDSAESYSSNVAAGNVPSARLLLAARRAVFGFAVGAVVLLFIVGRLLGGTIAGLAAVILALANPLLTTLWTRALAEGTLAFFTLATMALALRSLPRATTGTAPPALPMAAGVTLGLAGATKLSGGIGAPALGIFALMQQGLRLARRERPAGLRLWFDLGAAAVLTFVIVNPLLYSNPVGNGLLLLAHRRDEMTQQRAIWPDQAVGPTVGERFGYVARRAFGEFGSLRPIGPVAPDGALVGLGLAVVASSAWHEATRRREPREHALFLAWVSAAYAIVTANLGFDSSHYYAPLVTLNVILSGVAVGAAARWLVSLAQKVQEPFKKKGMRTTQTSASAAMPSQGNGPLAARSSTAAVENEPTT